MADAQEIYRRFCATPLRLRGKQARSPTASPSSDSAQSLADATTPVPPRHDSFSASAFVTPMKATPSRADLDRLEARIESACRVRDDVEPVASGDSIRTPPQPATRQAEATRPQPTPQRRTRARTRASKAAVAPSSRAVAVAPPKKQKRVTRSVEVLNSNTGGVYLDTPTKAMAPPKRSRKTTHAHTSGDTVESGEVATAKKMKPVVISKDMMDAFADIDEVQLGALAMEPPKSARKKTPTHRTKTASHHAYLVESGMKTLALDATDSTLQFSVKKSSSDNNTADTMSITRNIMNDFDDSDSDDALPAPAVVDRRPTTEKKTASRRPAMKRPPKQATASATSGDDAVAKNYAHKTTDITIEEADKENVMDPMPTSRNILDEFTDSDELQRDPASSKNAAKSMIKSTSRRQTAPRRAKAKSLHTYSEELVIDKCADKTADDRIHHITSEMDKENVSVDTISVSRKIMDDFTKIENPLHQPIAEDKPEKNVKKASTRQSMRRKAATVSAESVVENLTIETRVQPVAPNTDEHAEDMETDSISATSADGFVHVDVADPTALENIERAKKKPVQRRKNLNRQAKAKKNPALTSNSDAENSADAVNENRDFVGDLSITSDITDDVADSNEAPPDISCGDIRTVTKTKAASRRQAGSRQIKPKKSGASVVEKPKSAQEPIRRSRRILNKIEEMIPTEALEATEQIEAMEESTVVDEAMVVEESKLSMETPNVRNAKTVDESMPSEMIEPVEVTPPPHPQPPVIDVIEAFCKPLLQTGTTSGALFALWFNALGREVEVSSGEEADTLVGVLRDFFGACLGIGRIEAMARARVRGEDSSAGDDLTSGTQSNKTKRKSVRFRHFDLSSLNLRYNEDRSVAGFVDGLVREYIGVVDHITKLWDRRHNPAHVSMVAHVIGVLSDTDRLAERTKGDNLVSTTFRSMSEFEHDEVRASQPFFSDEFAKLLSGSSTQPTFMEVVFSCLIQSLVRFRLRELFLPFDPKALLDEGDQLQIATYDHQDFGAAIHRALKEVYLYSGLATPLLAILEDQPDPRSESVKSAVQALDIDDLVHVERFMLASRYLRLSFGTCVLLDRDEDEETAQLCGQLEQLCALVKRLTFEDEAHLFPLTSVEDFVRGLERREPVFVTLEKVLDTVGLPHYDVEAPCVECNEIVTRAQQAEAISCSSCSGRFHLGCLGLPLSFAQFTGNYTCPFCYLGRTR